jgi:hypothetical protein
MKHLLVLSLIALFGTLSVEPISAGSGSNGPTYSILVESKVEGTSDIHFAGAYVAYDGQNQSGIVYLEGETPFQVEVSGTYFLGMFQTISADERVEVTLTKYEDGTLLGHAKGTSRLNFLHGGPEGIGYGLPHGLLGLSDLQKGNKY